MKRAKWEPSQSSVICSKHFIAEDFTRRLDLNIEGQGTPLTPWLQRDDFGICAIPSIHASAIEAHSKPQSDRQRRMAVKAAMREHTDLSAEGEPQRKAAREAATSEASTSGEDDHPPVDETVIECSHQQKQLEISSSDPPEFDDLSTVEECGNCMMLKETNRQLLNRVKTLSVTVAKRRKERKNELRKHRRKEIKCTIYQARSSQ
ncbi:uncharacterized protein LOC111344776 [Stylophora pistillata]|uniref:uncharacterized protein LOC111344776 n=1 Tax=Stylophora pistillata TaxID=50429 RepID=UPI000C04A9DE|nr:uncharacterized protein LOC111344776 [Stylophora pistillata]